MKKIFIRDAGVILPKTNNKYFTKKEFFLRLDNSIKLSQDQSTHLQITISKDFFLKYYKNFISFIERIKKLKKVVVHLHASYNSLIKDDKKTKLFVKKLNKYANLLGNVKGYCVHPDNVKSYKIIRKLIYKKRYLAIEVTDLKSRSGNNFNEIKNLLEKFKFLKLVLDTSHIEDIRKKKKFEPTITEYFKVFKKKVVEIQISSEKNKYSKNLFSKRFQTDHCLLALSDGKIFNEIKKISGLKKLNLIIEGVIPYNKFGKQLVKREIYLLNKLI